MTNLFPLDSHFLQLYYLPWITTPSVHKHLGDIVNFRKGKLCFYFWVFNPHQMTADIDLSEIKFYSLNISHFSNSIML